MRHLLMILAFCLCIVQSVVAQPATQRKKVAVVLSGGGAKGMAHIGALKVIEQAGIPIDIVTGTSMGSIIGGLYACGNSVDKLDSIVRVQDWVYVLSDKDDLSHQSLREREKQNTYVFSTSIKGRSDAAVGGGLILGKNINTLFNALTAPYNDSIDFNKLPIPFACVATNIVDNTEYVFHSGLLSVAMRASMSIPAAFSPVRMGDMVLVDGGLRNNFPADIAKEMGADYIIGVSVQGAEKTADELSSTASVLSQIIDVNCKNKYEENLALTDIPIMVNVAGYSAASFTPAAIDTLIRRGQEAAMAQWDKLVELRNKLELRSQKLSPRILINRQPLMQPTKYKIGELHFVNMSAKDESFLRKKFSLKEGDSIDNNRADLITTSMRLDLFYNMADFRIFNNAVTLSDGSSAAKVMFEGGTKRSNLVSVGLRFDNEEMVALQALAELPLRTKLPMEFDFTMRLGKRIMGRVDWSFHPTGIIRPTISYIYRHNDINIYEYGEKGYNLTYNQHTAKVMPLNFNVRNFDISIGAMWDFYNFSNMLVNQQPEHLTTVPDDQHYYNYLAEVNYNSENEWYFPTRGAKFRARFSYITDDFVRLRDETGILEYNVMWRMSFRMSRHLVFRPMLYGRMLFGKNPPFIISNVIGGQWFGHYMDHQVPFAGIDNVEQAWDKLVAAQMTAQVNLTQNNIVLLRFAAGQNADELENLLDHSTMLGGTLSYYYNTMFGPLGASVGYCNITKEPSFFVNLGFVF